MKRLFSLLTLLAFLLAAGIWGVLLTWPPYVIAGLGDAPTGALYFSAIFGVLAGGSVWAFGDRCLQFIGASCAVVALMGLAAFHSTHTHSKQPLETPNTEIVDTRQQ